MAQPPLGSFRLQGACTLKLYLDHCRLVGEMQELLRAVQLPPGGFETFLLGWLHMRVIYWNDVDSWRPIDAATSIVRPEGIEPPTYRFEAAIIGNILICYET